MLTAFPYLQPFPPLESEQATDPQVLNALEALEAVALRDYRPGFIPVAARVLWNGSGLMVQLGTAAHTADTAANPPALVLYLDPMGDSDPGGSASHFEIALHRNGSRASRVVRRTRSGSRFDPHWQPDGAYHEIRPSEEGTGWSAILRLPFQSLGSVSPGTGWRIGAVASGDIHDLRPAPPLVPLLFGHPE